MRDRYGVWRHYLRRPGFKRVPLSGLYGTEEFAESYRLAMGGSITVAPREIGANRAKPGSIDALVAAYFKSENWTKLAKNSRHTRRPILERLRSGAWGSAMVRDVAQKHVRAMLDKTGHGKRHQLNALRGLFTYAVETELIESDPSGGIKVTQPKSDGYHGWTDERSRNTAPTGRSGLRRGWCSNSRWKPRRAVARWCGSVHGMCGTAESRSRVRRAATTWTSRSRPSFEPQSPPCRTTAT
jgi:hypothetical protein